MSAPEHHFNPELATPSWRRRLKASEPGRVLAALYRRRRLPKQVLGAPGGLRAAKTQPPAPGDRRRVRAVCWMPAGPGAQQALLDTWASAVASSPGEVALLVTDDWTSDCDAASLRALVPDALVVRPRLPTGGPPRLWPVTTLAIEAALAHFDFDLLIKLDTDALVVGEGWIDAISAAVAADEPSELSVARYAGSRMGGNGSGEQPAPIQDREHWPPDRRQVGIAGAFRERADGGLETDEDYHRRVLAGEDAHDPVLSAWVARARDAGWPDGSIVQGGCLVLTRPLCEAIVTTGATRYTPRLRTIVSEDLLLTVLAYAFGFRAASLSGPAGPMAIANKHLPVELGELLDPDSRWVVTHSTKVGLGGEPESELRERARDARQRWNT